MFLMVLIGLYVVISNGTAQEPFPTDSIYTVLNKKKTAIKLIMSINGIPYTNFL